MPTLDTLTNEPEAPRHQRDYVRTGIQLAVFGAWLTGMSYGANYLAEMASEQKLAEVTLPIFMFGSIPVLIGMQYLTGKVLDRVRPYRNR